MESRHLKIGTRALAFVAICLVASNGFAQSLSADDLWSIAKEVGDSPNTKATEIFRFTTPGEGQYIYIQFVFYINYSSATSCSSSQGNKPYINVCIDASHANKTYYITPEALFTLYNAVTTTTTACSRMRDISDSTLSNAVNMTCTSGGSCTGSVTTVSKTFGSNGSCTP